MKIYEGKKFVDVKIYTKGKGKDTILMNESCLKSKDCQSRRVSLGEVKGLAGHPGSKACKKVSHSEYKILKDKSGNQYGFCRFKDGTMISAWSLIRD